MKTVEERVTELTDDFRKRVLAEFSEDEVLVVAIFVKTLLKDYTRIHVNPNVELVPSVAQDMVNKLDASFAEVVDGALSTSPSLLRAQAKPAGVS